MRAHRQVDLHGSISASDATGRSVQLVCTGEHLKIDADSVRAALSALSAVRALVAGAAVQPLVPQVLDRLNDFRIDLHVGGLQVGRAGFGVRPGWLGRWLTKIPLELHASALLRVVFRAF